MGQPRTDSGLSFVTKLRNHAEARTVLVGAGLGADLQAYDAFVLQITKRWFELGRIHLSDAEVALRSASRRAAFSRAYYAAYSASKAVRYLVRGCVSLAGDDHRQVGKGLPDDFPDVDSWSRRLIELYEHRLRADYDNWEDTAAKDTLTPDEAVRTSRDFMDTAAEYLKKKFGAAL